MKLAVIGGTGLDRIGLERTELIDIDTPWGAPSGPVLKGMRGGETFFFLNRHGPRRNLLPHQINYRANLAALRELGAEAVLGVNAVGGIGQAMTTGVLALPDQLIDYTWGREHTYAQTVADAIRHLDFTEPYHPGLRRAVAETAAAEEMTLVEGGVYGVTQGPRLETAAEIRRLERDGCDLVGMTGMPEARLAQELDLPYACLALVVNPAAGKQDAPITDAEMKRATDAAAVRVEALIGRLGRQRLEA